MSTSLFAPMRQLSSFLIVTTLFAAQATPIVSAQSFETGFTYQGYLQENGAPAAGSYDLRFILYDAESGGSQVGSTVTEDDVEVAGGVFAVELDFGNVFNNGALRYLEVGLRDGASTGTYTTLSPREALRPTPTALTAFSLPNVTVDGAGNVGIGTAEPTSPLTVAGAIESTDGGIKFPDGTTQSTAGVGSGSAWQLGGNSGTDPASDYLGTADATPLELRAGGQRILRLEPALDGNDRFSPNVIGGHPVNYVAEGVWGATISGGGGLNTTTIDSIANVVEGIYGTVGGGSGNVAVGDYATVGGGNYNGVGGPVATVGGGISNDASEPGATVGGGRRNASVGEMATVGGGSHNTASEYGATVGGGSINAATADLATVSGGENNLASHQYSTVGGGDENEASGRASVVGGGNGNIASDTRTTIAGGKGNVASKTSATVGGGWNNTASGEESTVGGGQDNVAGGSWSTVPGGYLNEALSRNSFAAGYKARVKNTHDGTFIWSDNWDPDYFTSTGDYQFLVQANGGVGIGTNAPKNQFHVRDSLGAGALIANHVAVIENAAMSDGDVLALKTDADTPGSGENFITFKSAIADVGAIEGNGTGGVEFKSGGADFAELLPRERPEEHMSPGDIVGVNGGRITRTTGSAERLMVITDRALIVGNVPAEGEEGYEKVAFIGQVPVKVRGPVQVGEYIVASGLDDGVGRAVSPEAWDSESDGPFVGQAWESQESGIGRVNTVVGLDHTNALVDRLVAQQAWNERQATQIEEQKAQISALESKVRRLESLAGRIDSLEKMLSCEKMEAPDNGTTAARTSSRE